MVEISQFVQALVWINPSNGMEIEIPSGRAPDYGRIIVGFSENNNARHYIRIYYARSDVLKQLLLPFLKVTLASPPFKAAASALNFS